MRGETVWAETASPKNENCKSSRDKTLFILRIPSVQKTNAITSQAARTRQRATNLRGLGADRDSPRVTRYRKVRRTGQRKQDAVGVAPLGGNADPAEDLRANSARGRCCHVDVG